MFEKVARRRPIPLLRAHQIASGTLFEPLSLVRKTREWPAYLRNLATYVAHQRETSSSFRFRFRYIYPALGDRAAAAGETRGHYFHQDLAVAREIFKVGPQRHVDVGSSVAGFIAHLLAFREVEYVDIRPLPDPIPGLRFTQGSMLGMPYPDESLESLSALHSPEHVGLGRYGDPIRPNGWHEAMREFVRVLAPEGRLYLSVPIGPERLEFDAHRVFAPQTVLEAVTPLHLVKFSYVDDQGRFFGDTRPSDFSGWFGCGIFVFSKLL